MTSALRHTALLLTVLALGCARRAPPVINGVPGGATFGQPCAMDQDCTGPGERCSNGALANGTIFPQPICIAPCTVHDASMLEPCAGQDSGVSLGFCVGDMPGQGAWCLPACGFDSTTYTVACAGMNACQVRGIGRDTGNDAGVTDAMRAADATIVPTSPTIYGVGVCWGGCKTDTECTGGDVCQVETGECVHQRVAYTKNVGDSCDGTMDQANCNCVTSATTHQGYCSRVCTVGGFDCISGYTCSAQLPSNTGMVRFSGQPNGIQGHCLLRCTPPPPADAGVHDAGTPDSGGMDAGLDAAMDAGSDASDSGPRDVYVFREVMVPDVPVVCPSTALCSSTAGAANTCVPGNGM